MLSPMRWLVIVLCVALAACSKDRAGSSASPAPSTANAPATPETAFWKWFGAHATEIGMIASGKEPIAAELAGELHKIDAGLTFAIGNTKGEHELVVSADGKMAVFPAVKRLVAAAPVIAGWKITAFRPRQSTDMALELGDGTHLSSSDLSFRVLGTNDRKVDIELYVKGPKTITDSVGQVVFLLLDQTLGEYDVETYLGGIEMKPGTEAPTNALPLTQLPKTVDCMK